MASSIVVQTFTASGTYTPTANMVSCIVVCIGGGAGGADATATDEAGGGGGGGGTAIKVFQAATIGASQTVTVGAQVASDTSGNTSGFGTANALLQSTGGTCNTTGTGAFSVVLACLGGAGGVGTSGDLNIGGAGGGQGIIFSGADGLGGYGGSSIWGGAGLTGGSNVVGGAGGLYGGGGAGGSATGNPNVAGGVGAAGVVYIIELIDTGNITADMWMGSSRTQPLPARVGIYTQRETRATPSASNIYWVQPTPPAVPRPPARPFFSQARTLTFSEMAPLDWIGSRPVKAAVKSFLLRDTASFNYPVVSAEGPITPDKWTPPDAIVRRPPARPYFSQARTLTFSELAPLDWLQIWQGFSRRANRVPRSLRTDILDTSNPAGETITLDKWNVPTPRISLLKKFISRYRSVQYAVEIPEDITADKWAGSQGKIIIPIKRSPSRELTSYGKPTTFAEATSLDKWTGSANRSYAKRHTLTDRNIIIPFFGAGAAETITLDKWRGNERALTPPPKYPTRDTLETRGTPAASNVYWIQGNSRLWQPVSARVRRAQNADILVFTAAETVTTDKWTPPALLIPRPSARPFFSQARTVGFVKALPYWFDIGQGVHLPPRQALIDRNVLIPFFGAGAAETITPDKWIGSPGQVIRARMRSASRDLIAAPQLTSFGEIINADKWFDPNVYLKRPTRLWRERDALYPLFTGAAAPEVITLDKWVGSAGQIIRPIPRSISKELNDYPRITSFGEIINIDKWVGSTGRVVIPAKRSISNELVKDGGPAPFIEIVTSDKWAGSQGQVIRPTWRSLSKELNDYPRLISFGEIIQLDKWIGSQGRMIDTRRVVRRDAVNQNLQVIENITPDKWIGSLGQVIRALRRSESRELTSYGKPIQFNEIITLDKWLAVWNQLIIRPARPPMIVDLYGHTLIPRADVALGQLEIWVTAPEDRTYTISRQDRTYIVPPPGRP